MSNKIDYSFENLMRVTRLTGNDPDDEVRPYTVGQLKVLVGVAWARGHAYAEEEFERMKNEKKDSENK